MNLPWSVVFSLLGLLGLLSGCDTRTEPADWAASSRSSDSIQALFLDPDLQPPLKGRDLFLEDLRDRLTEASTGWEIGTVDGPAYSTWGQINDITTDRQGNVFALDAMQVQIRVFSSDGEFKEAVLREGGGPLEMRSPTGLEWVSPDTLLVHSTSQVRFLSFHDPGFQFERGFLSSRGVLGLCVLGEQLFVRTASPTLEGTVRVVTMDGEGDLVFGTMAEHANPAVRASLSMGGIACGRGDGGWVATFLWEDAELHGYTVTGQPKWMARIADFSPPELEVMTVGGSRGVARSRDEPSDRVLSVLDLTDISLLVQVARIGPRVEERGRSVRHIQRIDSYVMSAETGAGAYVGFHLPQILHATDSALLGVVSDSVSGVLRLRSIRW